MKETFKNILADFWGFGLPKSQSREVSIPLNSGKIITVTGVRRCGKSHLLYEGMKQLLGKGVAQQQIIYVSFDDERIDCSAKELGAIMEAHLELNPSVDLTQCHLFFDEIQNIEGWETFVRRIYDRISKNIYITGSNSKMLSRELSTSLRGRSITLELHPLSWSEYGQFVGAPLQSSGIKQTSQRELTFERFFVQGGFPELVFLDQQFHRKTLSEYVSVMIFQDLIERYDVKNTAYLKFLMKQMMQSHGSPFSVNKAYNNIKSQGYKVSKNTIYSLMEQLQDIYLFMACQKFHESSLKSEKSEKKIYAIDTALLNLYDDHSANEGKKLELLVYLELIKRGAQVWYHKNGSECDFMVQTAKGWIPIQVTWSLLEEKTRKREIKGLLQGCQSCEASEGFIVTRRETSVQKIDDVDVHVVGIIPFLDHLSESLQIQG